MEATTRWILLRCGPCGALSRIPRGLPVAHVRCPSCRRWISVPEGTLDPTLRFAVFVGRGETPPVPGGGDDADSLPVRRAAVGGIGRRRGTSAAVELAPSRIDPDRLEALRRVEQAARSSKPGGDTTATAPSDRAFRSMSEETFSPDRPVPQPVRYLRPGDDPVSWDSAEASAPEFIEDDPMSPWVRPAAWIAVAALAGMTTFYAYRLLRPPVGTDTEPGGLSTLPVPGTVGGSGAGWGSAATGSVEEPAGGVGADRDPLVLGLDTARRFLEAGDLASLGDTIRDAGRVGPLVAAWWRDEGGNPFPAKGARLPGGSLRLGPWLLVDVAFGDGSRRTLVLERSARGYLADWESFVGYSQVPWTELLVRRPRKPVLVRARVSGGDRYEGAFGDASEWACFRLGDPGGDIEVFAYAKRSSPDAVTLSEKLAGSETRLATLRIRYPDTARQSNQVLLYEFVEPGWVVGGGDLLGDRVLDGLSEVGEAGAGAPAGTETGTPADATTAAGSAGNR